MKKQTDLQSTPANAPLPKVLRCLNSKCLNQQLWDLFSSPLETLVTVFADFHCSPSCICFPKMTVHATATSLSFGNQKQQMNFQEDWFLFSSVCDKAFTELVTEACEHFQYKTYFQMFFVSAVDRERICRSILLWPNFYQRQWFHRFQWQQIADSKSLGNLTNDISSVCRRCISWCLVYFCFILPILECYEPTCSINGWTTSHTCFYQRG